MKMNGRTAYQRVSGLCAFLFFCSGTLPATAAPPATMPHRPKLSLVASTSLAERSPLFAATYIEPTGLAMVSPSGSSADNGRTWTAFTPQPDTDSKLPHGYRREAFPWFLDHGTGRLVKVINCLDTPGLDPTIEEPPEALKNYYLRYRTSIDGGRTYGVDEPIVAKGDGFTAEHPMDGVWRGKNGVFLGDFGSQPIRTRKGKMLVPVQACVVDEAKNLVSPGGGPTYTDVIVLIGTWLNDREIEWEASRRVQGDPRLSTRGMIEPTLAAFPDGRILMVMRGSNESPSRSHANVPGTKWFSVSNDGGRTWTKPDRWTYADGQPFFSPSSMSQLITHSNGRYYWIGNISPTNPYGNDPRTPLVIGEVDPTSLKLIQETVTTVDERRPEDVNGVELSPHAATFEDRETGDLVLATSRFAGGYKSSRPHLYRIAVK